MTNIRIERLVLENFKCHKWLELDFGGENVTVRGDNAAGKTSVYDAFAWLLFGKDSRGDRNAQVRPVNDAGEVADREAVTGVEAVLRVNGEPLQLRRALREVWPARREKTVSLGCAAEYAVDGVACRRHVFQARVEALVTEERFFLLSSVYRFARDIPWQKRREVLLALCGEGGVASGASSLKERALAGGETPPLRKGHDTERGEEGVTITDQPGTDCHRGHPRGTDCLSGLPDLVDRRRGLAGARNQIPARLSECQRVREAVGELHYITSRMEQLRAESETAARELARIENLLTIAGEQTRCRARAMEGQLEGLFALARFRFSRVLQCGTVEDRCDVYWNGVPYSGLNTGMQVRLGMDMVNTLSAHFGVWLPLFVDNAEGVTRLEKCNSQVIRLAVAEGVRGLEVQRDG